MYEEVGCFDPNPAAEATADSGFSEAGLPPPLVVAGSTTNSHGSMEEFSEFHLSPQDNASAAAATQLQFRSQLPVNSPSDQIQNSINNSGLIHQMVHDPPSSIDILPPYVQSHWDSSSSQGFVNTGPNPATPDLLSLLHLPRCSVPASLLPNPSISFASSSLSDIMAASSVTYDPLFHLNVPLQPSLTREQSQLLPNGHSAFSGLRTECLLGVDDQIEANGGVIYADGNHHGQFDSGILEFNTDMSRKGRGSGKMKPFTTERERRIHLKDRFLDLKNLIPNPTKGDRASIVGEAIDYIKELLRTIEEFKLLVEKKRRGKHRSKRARVEEGGVEDPENKLQSDLDQSFSNNNNCLRSSWLRRKSKVTEVDVRIIDNEVTIKLVQKKKINCLLFVSKVLDQLQLDLHHVAGGQIGEHYSFLFNTKIYEGSCVYASAIADTLMDIVEKQYMAALPTNGY